MVKESKIKSIEKQENILSKKIVKSLQQKLKKFSKLNIGVRKQILLGAACGVSKKDLKLIFQSAEQDIVIYLESKDYHINLSNNKFLGKFPKSIPEGKILIPLMIFEVKYKSVITHSVRQYSEIARMTKSVFPFCMFNFLLLNLNNPKESDVDKIYMSSKNFDRILYYPDYDGKNHNKIIGELWKVIEQHIDFLKKDKFLRLNKFLK